MTKQVVTAFGSFNDDEINTLKKGLGEMSDVMTMIDASKETLKEQVNHLHDELSIPKFLISRLAKVHHIRTFEKVAAENQEFESLYEALIQE